VATSQTSPLLRHLRRLTQPVARTDRELLERFTTLRDEVAFAELVGRHGPLVFGVCRRTLQGEQDAEDAFQATFLVLARKATSIRKSESLASWLYGVAWRSAMRLRADLAERRRHERARAGARSPDHAPAPEPLDLSWREVQDGLHDELARLPEKYRGPLVLCYLEGQTQSEAARQLGCGQDVLGGRLDRGRECLRQRLVRRGITLSAALLATAVSQTPVSAALLKATARLASRPASEAVTALANAVSSTGLTARIQVAALVLLAVGLGGIGLTISTRQPATGNPQSTEKNQPKAESGQPRTDAFGDPLPAEAIARIGTVRFRHGNHIGSLHYTADGKEIVSHSLWEGICVWDAATGRELRHILPEQQDRINAIDLSRDGQRIAGTLQSFSGVVEVSDCVVWERTTGKRIKAIGKGKYSFPRFAPDGNMLAIIDYDGSVELWDVDADRSLRSWKAHEGWIGNALFLPDGKTLLTSGSDQTVRFWDVATGNKVRELAGLVSTAGSLAVSPDGKRLASVVHKPSPPGVIGGERLGNEMQIWDLASGKELRRLSVPVKGFDPETTFQLAYPTYSHDGKVLAATGVDEFLHLWDAHTGTELRRMALGLNSHGMPVFAPDDRVLAVTSHQNAIRLFETASGKEISPASDAPFRQFMVALTPDNRHIIAPDYHRSISIWDTETAKRTGRLTGYEKPVWSIRLARDGRTLYSSDLSHKVRCWDLATRSELRGITLNGKGSWSEVKDISPDGSMLAMLANQNTLTLVDAKTLRVIRPLAPSNQMTFGGVFTPDGHTLIEWNGEHGAVFWDVATGKELRRIEYREAPVTRDRAGLPVMVGGPRLSFHAALSPDGRFIAFGSKNRMIALHDVESGKEVRRVEELPDMPDQLVFSPDGRTLAWGGYYDPAVKLLETTTLRERHRLTGHKGGLVSLTFSADSQLLVSSGTDATALVWDLRAPASGALDIDAAWRDLARNDAAKAYQQVRRLAVAPTLTMPYLSKRLQPAAAADVKRLEKLTADLDSDTFAVREQAAKELEKLGEAAAQACRKALEASPSPEVRRSLEKLLEKNAQQAWSPSPDHLRDLRAIEAVELAGTPKARQLLEKLAAGAPEARLTREAKAALERLTRR
jgi:RNA polymerase sigma factor (sigma-70 family)